MAVQNDWRPTMNARAESSAVAGTNSIRRPAKPRPSRSRFAYLFDFTDAKESRMCSCMSLFHLGKNHEAVKLKRIYRAVGGESHRVIFEVVKMPRRPPDERWAVIGWDID